LQEQVNALENELDALRSLPTAVPALDPVPVLVQGRPATRKQTWAIFTLTGCDMRGKIHKWNLTTTRASHLISAAVALRKAA